MKRYFILSLFTLSAIILNAQSATDYFNRAGNEYLYKSTQVALNTINMGLNKYPNDPPLTKLKEKINKDKQQKNKQKQDQKKKDQQKQDQQKQDQQKQDQQKQDQQKQDQQQSENQKQADQQKKSSDQAKPKDTQEKGEKMNKPPQSSSERLKEMKLSEEKARMILDAMKNNEIQYIQQNRRKATKKPNSDKPDW